jgi:hypothetical protein
LKDFSTADGTGDGNAATQLAATRPHTASHSNRTATATQPQRSSQHHHTRKISPKIETSIVHRQFAGFNKNRKAGF